MKGLIGYKVVKKVEDVFVSAGNLGEQVIYNLNSVAVYPKNCGPLCIFNTLDQAKDFIKRTVFNGNFAILKCNYIKSNRTCLWIRVKWGYKTCYMFPWGTILADEIMPMEVVE